MKDLAGRTAVVTGASGGLGGYLVDALADAGMNLLLVAFPGGGLAEVTAAARRRGVRAACEVLDVRDPAQRVRLVETAEREWGGVDLLVNNAGVEFSAVYHSLAEGQVREVLAVNLEAPLLLARLVLPGMVARGRGHIVSISSLAGKSGPAYQEPYAATKAGLTSFTASLRATYRGTGVSASVVCPGFVEAGIYTRLKALTGRPAPWPLAACPPQRVGTALVRAVRRDLPEVLVTRYPMRPVLALAVLSPRLGEWLTRAMGVHEFFRSAAAASASPPSPPP
jgi:NAD(P)-dependent dehydrogenase (short-subunit alcohol dehydrogenase family)